MNKATTQNQQSGRIITGSNSSYVVIKTNSLEVVTVLEVAEGKKLRKQLTSEIYTYGNGNTYYGKNNATATIITDNRKEVVNVKRLNNSYTFESVIFETLDNNLLNNRMERFKNYLNYSKMEHKEYQYEGVCWMLKNELSKYPLHNVRGGFIADDMGLGKTIMMIGICLCNFVSKTLIVVPPVLLSQWFIQIYQTTGHIALIYYGNDKKQINDEMLNKAIIVITTYGTITMNKKQIEENDFTKLHKCKWSRVVFDEAHHLRNNKTNQYKSCKKIEASIIWLISGTPIQNKKQDFYSLCEFIKLPKSFYNSYQNLRILAKTFILKRTKKEVGIIISNIIQNKSIVNWSNIKEKEIAKKIHSTLNFKQLFANATTDNKTLLEESNVPLLNLLHARQCCILPKMIKHIGASKNSSSKIDFVIDTILKRKENGLRKLIFCHFREEIDEIIIRLKAGGMTKVATIDGRTRSGKRYNILNENEIYETLILQIQTGCEGINLQNYNEIFFISPHWNPAIEDQAIARCHRIGQTKTVYVWRFEMASFSDKDITADNYVTNIQNQKRNISKTFHEDIIVNDENSLVPVGWLFA